MDFQTAQNFLLPFGLSVTAEQYQINANKMVVVGMSGGVDSSVCALILKLQGYKVVGMFMKNWDDQVDSQCTAKQDYQDVASVCEQLDIPYYAINFVKEYRENVFETFLQEYRQGYTPNPDILCNREIKFKVFFQKAMALGADFLATGHYCQNQNGMLIKGADNGKDQSYFLYTIKSEILNKVLFPVGGLQKPAVRQIASAWNLATSKKKDSTGICFIGERDFREFLSGYLQSVQGDFVRLETGKVMGKHHGQCFYTIGQRKGLGLGGPGGPWFVAGKDVASNIVFVVEGEHHPALYAQELIAGEISWVKEVPQLPLQCKAKIRYRGKDEDCLVTQLPEGKIKVVFTKPQRAIAVRQSVVFYQGEQCLGGAIIEQVGASLYESAQSDLATTTI